MVLTGTHERTFVCEKKVYLDSQTLLQELKNIRDLLGSGLIGLSSPERSVFFNPNIPNSETKSDSFISKPFEHSKGTRILPVYVFSLVGEDADLLFENHSRLVM